MSISNIILSGNTQNNKGALQLPNLTEIEKTNVTARNGMTIYNIDTDKIELYTGTQWIEVETSTLVEVEKPNFYIYQTSNATLPVATTQLMGQTGGNTVLSIFELTYNAPNRSVVVQKGGVYNILAKVVIDGMNAYNTLDLHFHSSVKVNGAQILSTVTDSTQSQNNNRTTFKTNGTLVSLLPGDEISYEFYF